MSIPIVQHVWQKSQTRGSARTLLLTLAIHANECCGVAWPADQTVHREVNVSRQRGHELKNTLEAAGELVIVERPGTTNLYFVAMHGKPLGRQGDYLTTKRSQHTPGCPLRDPAMQQRCAHLLAPGASPGDDSDLEGVSESSDPPRNHAPAAGEEGSEIPDPPADDGLPAGGGESEISHGGGQRFLTQKTRENERKTPPAPPALFALSRPKPEMHNPWWCDVHGFAHADQRPDCARERSPHERL